MSGVRLSQHFGIVIRKAALDRCDLDRLRLLILMEADVPFDEDDQLISFGPHFGNEACQTFVQRLETVGLQYGEDMIDIADTLPDWLHLFARLASSEAQSKPMESAFVPLSLRDALDIWSVLEALTVSLDKLGSYQAQHGAEAGSRALNRYFQPKLFRRIANARRKIAEAFIEADSRWDEKLDQLAENEAEIGYWQGEGTSKAG